MTDLLALLDTLKRPRLLINAARLGLVDYRREMHLPRQLGGHRPACSRDALHQLMDLEHEMNNRRRACAAEYSAARHVGLLIAMMAEARILRCSQRAGGVYQLPDRSPAPSHAPACAAPGEALHP